MQTGKSKVSLEHSKSYGVLMNAYDNEENKSLPDFKASPFSKRAME